MPQVQHLRQHHLSPLGFVHVGLLLSAALTERTVYHWVLAALTENINLTKT